MYIRIILEIRYPQDPRFKDECNPHFTTLIHFAFVNSTNFICAESTFLRSADLPVCKV